MQITRTQKEFVDFEIKNLGEYHDLHSQGDTLVLADVFENFRNKCLEMYQLDRAHFFSSWIRHALDLLTDINMFLQVQKG